jgi:hypothetical protein
MLPKIMLTLVIVLTVAGCKKTETPKPTLTELEKLPPITQTGANTFGCLINGVAWLPNGTKPSNGGPNISVDIDPNYLGGFFSVNVHKYNEIAGNYIYTGLIGCRDTGMYIIGSNSMVIQYAKRINNDICEISTSEINTLKSGFLRVTKYDRNSNIYSGIFEFKLYNPTSNCGDTIRITNGRFDVKL